MQIDRIGTTSFQPQGSTQSLRTSDALTTDPHVAHNWTAPAPTEPRAFAEATAVAAPAGTSNVSNLDEARIHLALSADVYNDTPNPPDGWRVAGQDDMDRLRLTPDMLERPDSDFRARVYVSDEGGETRYVVAFRGSQSGEDWLNNGQQAIGASSEHYDKALRIGQRLAAVEADVTLTGHSLGGGMASAAALTSGHEADTFNAAGLHASTIDAARSGGHATPDIDAFYLRGDPLSTLQDGGDRVIMGGLGAILLGVPGAILGGSLGDAAPAVGDRIPITPTPPEGQSWRDAGPGALHGVEWFHSSLEAAR
ncbi:MAG: hypothetical protein ACK4NU_04870 [Brevundimonas sp.]